MVGQNRMRRLRKISSRSVRSCCSLTATAAVLLLLAGCGEEPAPESSTSAGSRSPSVYDTPQAVFDAEIQAQTDGDWGAHFDTYATGSHDQLVWDAALGAIMYAAMPGKSEAVMAVFKKHGIDESDLPKSPAATGVADLRAMATQMEKQQTVLLDSVSDKRGFYIDVATLLSSMIPSGPNGQTAQGSGNPESARATAELTDLQIDGDTAAGKRELTLQGGSVTVPVHFIRVDGSWYLRQLSEEEIREQIGREVSEQMKLDGAQ